MRIIPLRKTKYEIIKGFINKIKRLGVFKKFDSSNIIIFKSKDYTGAVTFASEPQLENYGLSFFIGDAGLNTLYDMLSLDDLSYNQASYNLINVIYKKDKNLTPSDYKFLNSHNIEIKRLNNVIFNTFNEGYAMYNTTSNEADKVFEMVCALYVILIHKMDYLEEVFSKNDDCVVIADVDFKKLQFSISQSPLPYIERRYNEIVSTEEEINEFMDIDHKEYEVEIMTKGCNLPVKINECNKAVAPLMISINTPTFPLAEFETIISLPTDYRSQLIYILRDFFKENGIPTKIIINHRRLYYEIKDLLNKLGVEVILQLENPKYDATLEDINVALSIAYPVTLADQEIMTVPETEIRNTMNLIKRLFKAYQSEDGILVEDDLLKNPAVHELINIINQAQIDDIDDDDLEEDNNDLKLVS